VEANKLKSLTTKVVALGIGSRISQEELNKFASEPHDRNVILAKNFKSLTDVEELLTITICSGLWSYVIL